MPEVLGDRLGAHGVSLEALQANSAAARGWVIRVEKEGGHLMALGTFQVLQERPEEMEVLLPVPEVEAVFLQIRPWRLILTQLGQGVIASEIPIVIAIDLSDGIEVCVGDEQQLVVSQKLGCPINGFERLLSLCEHVCGDVGRGDSTMTIIVPQCHELLDRRLPASACHKLSNLDERAGSL